MENTDGYKSRKFIFSAGLSIIASVLLMSGYIDMTIWKDVIETIISAYLLGNTAERFINSRHELEKAKIEAIADDSSENSDKKDTTN